MRVELRGAANVASPEAAERALRRALELIDRTADEGSACRLPSGELLAMVSAADGWLLVRARPDTGAGEVEASGGAATGRLVAALRAAFAAEVVAVPEGEERFEVAEEPAAPMRAVHRVQRVLARRRMRHEELLLFESPGLGWVLALDGVVRVTELDAHVYYEVLAHPALFAHPDPRRVAIVGGGDGHLLAEVLKHAAVQEVFVLEPHAEVVEVCREHLEAARRAYADPRVRLRADDALGLAAFEAELDLVLCERGGPGRTGTGASEAAFFARCRRALRGPGTLVAQAGSLHLHRPAVAACRQEIARQFPSVAVLWAAMATYPGGWWTFVVGSTGPDPRVVRRLPPVAARLYRPDAHEWFFVPDAVLERLLG